MILIFIILIFQYDKYIVVDLCYFCVQVIKNTNCEINTYLFMLELHFLVSFITRYLPYAHQ